MDNMYEMDGTYTSSTVTVDKKDDHIDNFDNQTDAITGGDENAILLNKWETIQNPDATFHHHPYMTMLLKILHCFLLVKLYKLWPTYVYINVHM